MTPTEERLLRIFLETRTIAMVGASMRPDRDSHRVGQYLVSVGYRVTPVNPTYAGQSLFGRSVLAGIDAIDETVEMLAVFRHPQFVPDAVDAVIGQLSGLKTVWMPLGVESADARATAEGKGLEVVENRCLVVEHRRLVGPRP